jgi:DNA-binding transcriptional ArsR family regulator
MGTSKTEEFTSKENKIATYAKAFGHPARIAILKLLIQKQSCICGDIVDELPLSQSTVSQHLKRTERSWIDKRQYRRITHLLLYRRQRMEQCQKAPESTFRYVCNRKQLLLLIMEFRKYFAELVGTFSLVFCGTGAIIINQEMGGAVTHLGIAITFGLIVASMIFALGDISGAHLNPAVTLSFAIANRFPV